jgi:hypothetical protein
VNQSGECGMAASLGSVHTIFPSANGLKTAPIEARDDGQTGCLA